VQHAHRLLSLGLKRAVDDGLLARNVAAIRRPPKVEATEIAILTAEQRAAVLDTLREHKLYPIVALALSTGMRRGELLALQWADVDLDRAVLRVERSVEETKAGLRIKPPKTKRGRRNVDLSADVVTMLRDHRRQQLEIRLALGQGGQPSLVFSTKEGELLSPDNLSRDWGRVSRAKKLPRVPFHALRHTHASTLIRAGVDILTISRRLGHGKASVTLDTYGHLVEGAGAAAAAVIEGMLK
jgi:integrase